MNIHIFNPEHDIALAANSKFWTAPHAGRQLRADLGWLPVLWAEDGDIVIVNDVAQAENAVRKLGRKVSDISFVTLSKLSSIAVENAKVLPWGWDLNVVQQLKKAGVPDTVLPTDEQLARQREISDRATSSRLLADICSDIDGCVGEAVVLKSVDEVEQLMDEWGRVVLKSPWSSSGRGVRYFDDRPNNIIRWAEKVLKTQGHIMAERFMDKVMDFGMEFCIKDNGDVQYEGLSLFDTSGGAYTGSVLATEQEKMETLSQYVNVSLLLEIQRYICDWMKREVNGVYTGPFGVDMMICKSENGLCVNPCVEVNLRRTMGHVALAVSPKENGMREVMRIGYEGDNYHFRIFNDHEILF